MAELVRYRDQFPIISPHFYIRDDELDAVMREIHQIRESRVYETYLTVAKDTVT